jgi:predicted RNA-binding protein YlqC (UPF0109 family)
MGDETVGSDPIGAMLGHVVKAMVDHPNWVRVSHSGDASSDAYEVVVDNADLGKVIGKQGRVANSLRMVAKAVAEKRERRIYVDFTS